MLNFIPKIGIMQGRLSEPTNNQIQSFPKDTWKTEFEKAHQCGFQVLEWIFDDISNPLMNNSEIDEIILLSQKHNISINSVCADYFMNEKLFNVCDSELQKNFSILNDLIIQCDKIGVKIIEIPLVDSSSLQNKDNQNEFIQNLIAFLSKLSSNIIINLETDLPPVEFKTLLENFKDFDVYANYDTGNSASLGYDVNEEFKILKGKIKNIHIKDRIHNGTTVPFGLGDTNFDEFFKILKKSGYSGDLIIQGARIEGMNPEQNCLKYQNFIKEYLDKYS